MIGEVMIVRKTRRLECLGYAAYLDRLGRIGGGGDALINALAEDLREAGLDLGEARRRLVPLQHALVELLAFLDPECVRFSADRRTKVPFTSEPPAA